VILTIALARNMLTQVGLSFTLLFVSVLVSQMIRLGPLMVVALSDPLGFSQILVDILPRIIVIALPFSLPLGAFFAVDRMEKRRLNQMLSALGAPPHKVWLKAALLLGIWVAAATAPVSWLFESQAAEAFPRHALNLARQSVIAKVSPGQVAQLNDRLAVFAGKRGKDGEFEYVTVLSGRNVLSGRLGKLTGEGLRLELGIQDAELWRHTTQGLRRASANELRVALPASRNIARHLGFFHQRDALNPFQLARTPGNYREARLRRYTGWRRILLPLTVLMLPIFGVACALLMPPSIRLIGGVLVTVGFIALYVVGESVAAAGVPALLVAILPAIIAAIAASAALRAESHSGVTS
jgi:lipopolysaccharide export LptBFGC system permease protein LptF